MNKDFHKRFFTEVLKYLPASIFWKSENGVYLGCNDSFALSLGLNSPQDVIGKTDFSLPVEVSEARAYREDDLEVIRSKQSKLGIEEEQTFPDGTKRWLLTSKVPLSKNTAGVSGLLGIYYDITELKQTQQNYKCEKEKAERASKYKSDFIANMSHDLRTPITGMLGMSEDMLCAISHFEEKSAGQYSHFEMADLLARIKSDNVELIEATNELLQLCNEILDAARMQSGRARGIEEVFSLRELISHSIALLQPTAKHKKIDLSSDVSSDCPDNLVGCKVHLSRILLNLISNGLKFTHDGGVHVSVSCDTCAQKNDQPGESVTLTLIVKDTGIGIPNDKFDEIFGSFSRLTPSYEGIYKGAGLGLYMVDRYIKNMGGQIRVQSTIDEGTSFVCEIPFIIPDSVQDMTKCSSDELSLHDESENSELRQPLSILVVEDHKLAAIAVAINLKSLNCRVNTAETGSEALEMHCKHAYDLILMDIGLPDINGIELVRRIRRMEDSVLSTIPIVGLSGHGGDNQIYQEAVNAGMQEVICKPADRKAIEKILDTFVPNKS